MKKLELLWWKVSQGLPVVGFNRGACGMALECDRQEAVQVALRVHRGALVGCFGAIVKGHLTA